ncbi:MAG: CapA family protein, partial [Myxococcota bacterium]
VEVRLLDDVDGTRGGVQAGGDVMLGRRYLAPVSGDPLIVTGDGGASARAVVSDLAPAFGAADLAMVNLETVIGDFPREEAYPGKRFLLLTPPEGVAALHEMGTDVAGLANNHARDWLDVGIASTLDHLEEGDVPHLGAGLDAAEAAVPLAADIGDLRVAVLAFTSVEGDLVNDAYPRDGDALPEDPGWMWEPRSWGSPEHGVPVADRRIGSAWDALLDAEPGLDEDARAALWASAAATYPELQDWVARRGHGGANFWDATEAREAIAAAKEGADLVVVQLHMGFQFASVPGEGSRDAAHAAVEAGADLVVAHHPHVLQGLEWYRGKLIAWSLGNLVFDQDFLSTFRSAFLRTVWEADGTLVEARVVPVFLDRYRPVPAVDRRARDTLRLLWEASWDEALAERGSDRFVRSVAHTRVAGGDPVDFRVEHNTAVLLAPGESAETAVDVPAAGRVSIAHLPPV